MKRTLICTALALLTTIVASVSAQAPVPAPYVLNVVHLHVSVTVWSDGTLDISDSIQLTARSARRLANRLEDSANRRQVRQRSAQTVPVPVVDNPVTIPSTRCKATAVSSGQQCKNQARRSRDGTQHPFCAVHAPRTARDKKGGVR